MKHFQNKATPLSRASTRSWSSCKSCENQGSDSIARFLSPDPYVQLPNNTQSYNRYSYCMNNPLNLVDLTGLAWRPTYTEDQNGNRTYNGYEWVPEDQSYDQNGNLLAGLYHQAIFFSNNGTFDVDKPSNIGSSTATVYLADGTTTSFNASTMPSDPDIFATVPEGVYEATVGIHNGSKYSYPALKMRDIGAKKQTVELGTKNPNPTYTDGRTYSEGIDIHYAGKDNYTNTYYDNGKIHGVSEGCLLIDKNSWSSFINYFNSTSQKNNPVSVTVSRSLSAPVNANQKPAFNFFTNGTWKDYFGKH